ncbi:MAG: nitrate reductase molybdenum cofactor assembly chaperone [Dermatophilaceae bacterium]
MLWRRHRRTSPAWSPKEIRTTWQLASVLLDYPTPELVCRVPALRDALADVAPDARAGLTAYLDRLEWENLARLQSQYVDTFDVTRRCALYLTYYTCGDTRKRGVELVRFKQVYRDAGADFAHEELPDHLGVVLEFGAMVDIDAAWKLLCDHRVGIELLYRVLRQRDSAWMPVIEAFRTTLPTLDGTDEEALARLIAEGPPSEQVGLEGYALDPRLNPRPEPIDLGATIPVGVTAS